MLNFSKLKSFSSHSGDYWTIINSNIVNTKLEGGNNYLNYLIDKLTDENYDEVSEMIRIMLLNGCNPNHQNDELKSPFFFLLLKIEPISSRYDLINFWLDNANINFSDEIIEVMNAQGIGYKIPAKDEAKVDMELLMQQLHYNDEASFIKLFAGYTYSTDDIARLFEEAIARGLKHIVELLMQHVNEINSVLTNGRFGMSPAELACTFGHVDVLRTLFNNPSLKLKSEKSNLLHKVLLSKVAHEDDRKKCFRQIISDHRCTLDIIDGADQGQTPLSLACIFGFNDIAKGLLRRGAYIGHQSIVDNISKDLLQEFLDECVKCSSDINDKNCEVYLDYRFLMSPNVDEPNHPEMRSIHLIAENRKLKDLILHPVVSTFVELKWSKISFIVYFNLLVYFAFLAFYGTFVWTYFSNTGRAPENVTYGEYSLVVTQNEGEFLLNYDNWFQEYSFGFFLYHYDFSLCVIGIGLIGLNEIIQCLTSFKRYFTKGSNYFDIVFVILSAISLYRCLDFDINNYDTDKNIRAVTILMIAAQGIQLITKVSFFSMSLHMTIFKRVCSTFLKTMSLYLILIVAFAISFQTLHKADFEIDEQDEKENAADKTDLSFSDAFSAIIITVRMMVGDFEYIKLKRDDKFTGSIFLLFIILISIVLFNLLNALTISDTYNILKDAELVKSRKTVSILKSYEKMFLALKLSFANIFPKISSITLKPNCSDFAMINLNARFMVNNDVTVQIQAIDHKEKLKFLSIAKRTKTSIRLSAEHMQKIREFVQSKQQKNNL